MLIRTMLSIILTASILLTLISAVIVNIRMSIILTAIMFTYLPTHMYVCTYMYIFVYRRYLYYDNAVYTKGRLLVDKAFHHNVDREVAAVQQ